MRQLPAAGLQHINRGLRGHRIKNQSAQDSGQPGTGRQLTQPTEITEATVRLHSSTIRSTTDNSGPGRPVNAHPASM